MGDLGTPAWVVNVREKISRSPAWEVHARELKGYSEISKFGSQDTADHSESNQGTPHLSRCDMRASL